MPKEMLNLFAVPVAKSSIDRNFTESEIQCFGNELKNAVPAISNLASRNKRVLDSPPLSDLKTTVQEHLDDYFNSVHNTLNQVSLKITQSWLTMSRQGQSHHSHSHPNSVVSGVLYINLAPQDGINFYRNDDLWWYELIPREHNYYNAHRYFIETKVGDLVLFPSNIKHGVKEVSEDVERVSLAFNTFFTGELGSEAYSNGLQISVD